jgi:hypothetical protein
VHVLPAEQSGVGFEVIAVAAIGEKEVAIKPKRIKAVRALNILKV